MTSRGDLQILLDRVHRGDSMAWGRIYEMFAPSIFRLCRRALPTRQDAEDATSEIFLKARLRLAQYDRSRPFPRWLYRVAANHCWDELRKRRSRGEWERSETELANVSDEAPSPQQAVLARESREAVRGAIARLDERSRLALVLRYYGEMSYAEIAEVLEISPTFVGVLLLRARRAMRRSLTEGGMP